MNGLPGEEIFMILHLDYSNFKCYQSTLFSRNRNGLKRYYKNNELNYTLLKGEEETTKSYQVNGVPSFFILDKNRIIRKVIQGYEEITDKGIKVAINTLL